MVSSFDYMFCKARFQPHDENRIGEWVFGSTAALCDPFAAQLVDLGADIQLAQYPRRRQVVSLKVPR
jgi:hypothetical protein